MSTLLDKEDESLLEDEVFLAMTRPAMAYGIPYEAFVIEIMLTAIIFLAVGNPLYIFSCIPIHIIFWIVSSAKPTIFQMIYVFCIVNTKAKYSKFWNGVTFSTK